MTDIEVTAVANRAAEAAVNRILMRLGVDIDEPEAYVDFRRDLAHLRAWRESIDIMKRTSIKTAVGVLITGTLGLLWLAFKMIIKH